MTEQPQVAVVASSDEALPSPDSDTRSKIRKGLAITATVCAVLVLVDNQVRRFQRRKNLTVVASADVTDKPAS